MQERPPSERSAFRREWNFALALVAAAAVVLLATGYTFIGTLAVGLGGGAIAARWAATRRRGSSFYD